MLLVSKRSTVLFAATHRTHGTNLDSVEFYVHTQTHARRQTRSLRPAARFKLRAHPRPDERGQRSRPAPRALDGGASRAVAVAAGLHHPGTNPGNDRRPRHVGLTLNLTRALNSAAPSKTKRVNRRAATVFGARGRSGPGGGSQHRSVYLREEPAVASRGIGVTAAFLFVSLISD